MKQSKYFINGWFQNLDHLSSYRQTTVLYGCQGLIPVLQNGHYAYILLFYVARNSNSLSFSQLQHASLCFAPFEKKYIYVIQLYVCTNKIIQENRKKQWKLLIWMYIHSTKLHIIIQNLQTYWFNRAWMSKTGKKWKKNGKKNTRKKYSMNENKLS